MGLLGFGVVAVAVGVLMLWAGSPTSGTPVGIVRG
jgi:hypothetical protein